jgi:hypothetical protein
MNPADRPHRFVRRRLTTRQLPGRKSWDDGRVDSSEFPCNVCGSSELTLAHVTAPAPRARLDTALAAIAQANR